MGPRLPAGRPGDEREEKVAHSSVLTRTAQQLGRSFGTAVLAVILEDAVTAHPGRVRRRVLVVRRLLAPRRAAVPVAPGARRDRDRQEQAEASRVPAAAGSGKIDV